MPQFLHGRELSRRFYEEAVRPILDEHFTNLPHAAAHMGKGSDAIGLDTEMSTDHGWGPSVHIFLKDEDAYLAESIREVLSRQLPHMFYGYPVNFVESPIDPGTYTMQMSSDDVVNHHVFQMTVRAFFWYHLAYNIDHSPDVADWLTFPSQILLGVTTGAVHHDGIGELTSVRQLLAWYPYDVWLYLLACGWQRIGQEEHLMPRAGIVGDELGSAIIGSRLVHDVMSLCFLMEKQYAPYAKWFGTAFKRLNCADKFLPAFTSAHEARTWQEREIGLCKAYELLALMHNELGLTERVPENVSSFFGRPFNIIWGSAIADVLVAQITDPVVKHIASRPLIGSIDQFSDSTDLHAVGDWRTKLRELYL